MFLWRNILSAVCWVCCCVPLFAQDIDYSKCSCDSLFGYVLKGNYLKSYSDIYKGKQRYIEDNKCITVTDNDSTIVIYKPQDLWSVINDTSTLITIILKTDSIIFSKKNSNNYSEIELYQRKISNVDVEYKYFKKDFGLELRLKVLKSTTEKDSAFYYYSDKGYDKIFEENSNRISSVYVLSLPIKYTFTIDTNGYLDGRYIAYCPNGEIMTIQTFSHGVLNGYFYFTDACKLDEDSYGDKLKKGKYYSLYYSNESNNFEFEKGYYNNDRRMGKWIQKLELPSGIFLNERERYKKYVFKYQKDDKIFLRKFFIYKQIDPDSSFNLCYSNIDLHDMVNYVNILYRSRIADLPIYKSELQKIYNPNYKVIKIITK